jgi:hypothetical protein
VIPPTRFIAATLLAAAAAGATAAGGHHDVDDATVLAPQRCQLEAWLMAGRSPSAEIAHLGTACRFAALEWGLNADRVRIDGLPADTLGPQAKWAVDLAGGQLAVGAVLSAVWRTSGPAGTVITAYVPGTARVGTVQLHVNVGRDHDRAAGGFRRWGVAADWAAGESLTFTTERRSIFGQPLTRAGVRFALSPQSSVDASVAVGGDTRWIALGLNWEWAR